MAAKEYDVWLERFNREIGFKSSVIVFGNTTDIMLNPLNLGKYDSVINTIISYVRQKGFDKIVKWDRVDGIDSDISDEILDVNQENNATEENQKGVNYYDLGSDTDFEKPSHNGKKFYKDPNEFFPYVLSTIKNNTKKTAFILDYSDYIFGNSNALSEVERNYMATLGKVLEKSQSYNMLTDEFADIGNVVIVVAKNNAMIPPAFYLNNPMVSSINVPMPGRNEREKFVDTNLSCLRISQNISADKTLKDDFIDALEGFSLKEIAQIMKLSRQMKEESLTFEKLINLFKYGEKVSPWEELSKEKLEEIEERLGQRVKGQDEAIKKVKDVIIRAYTGFSGLQHSSKQKKPKGTLFFVGPTGVGKTELAKSLADFVFGDENACIRFDMSEYNHEHSDQRLVGAPPGYVGYEAGGQLTNAVKEKPFCVLLFDEIEKAHGRILDKFLQILEDGRLTDGKGETVYFSETIIIFTSNIGAAEVNPNMSPREIKKQFVEKVQKHFIEKLGRPELLNRIGDNIVAFNFIDDPKVFTQIAKVKFKAIEDFVKERYKATLKFEDEETSFMAIGNKAGKQNGGRGLLNTMETVIVNPLSEFIFDRSDMLTNRQIIIKPMFPDKPELARFEFELK